MSDSSKPISAVSPFWDVTISAFWMAFLAILAVNIIGRFVMPEEEGVMEKFGYPVAAVEEAPAAAGPAGPAALPDVKPLLAAASVEEGAASFRKCQTCHTITAGDKNAVGPNLHNIVGDAVGDRNGFKTSESLKSIGGNWDYDKLNDYINNPKHLAPKGTMSFAGIKNVKERAAVIKFLMSNTENPPPVPESAPAAESAAPAAPAAPAEAPK